MSHTGVCVIRVLVVDDHDLVRDTVTAVLRGDGGFDVVGACGDGHQAVQLFTTKRPDVVLMDLSMPVMGGVDATRQLRAIDPQARIVVLTSARVSREIDNALAAGALACVYKDAGVTELLRAVHAAATTDLLSPASSILESPMPVAVPARRRWRTRPRNRRS